MKKSIFRFILSALLLAATIPVMASDIVTVTGEGTFYDDGNHSRKECMRLAAEQARINALANEFGTIVSQDILQTDRISGNREHNDFLALSQTEVRGEWIADEGEPQYTFNRDKDENLIVHAKVRGKAKAIDNEATDFEALILRNSAERQAADNLFRDGDQLYLYFNTSADGYLAAFLQDEDQNVMQILPYPHDTRSRVPVKRNREYIFFSPEKRADQATNVEEMIFTAPEDKTEFNRIFVICSPEEFSRPVMQSSPSGFPTMNSREFSKWLIKTRRNDPKMGVKAMNVEIAPKD